MNKREKEIEYYRKYIVPNYIKEVQEISVRRKNYDKHKDLTIENKEDLLHC